MDIFVQINHCMRLVIPKSFLLISFFIIAQHALAGKITGLVTNDKGEKLAFASILIKGTTQGTAANSEGRFTLELKPGTYTLVCQYIGYAREETRVKVEDEAMTVNFVLKPQQYSMAEVVVKKGEDPAYGIIREAIKKRPFYKDQLKRYECEVYTKGIMRLRDFPKKFLGQKVDFEDGDTSKRKILYLSETVARYSVDGEDKTKTEVLSTRVSGSRQGFGITLPQVISFYESNVSFGPSLGSRGFVSPIAPNAIHFYKFKFEGSFFEDGREINKIKVTPRRRFEPLFTGYINITEGDWRIHSLQLMALKDYQLQFLDTLRVEQLYVPAAKDVWVIKSQVAYPSVKMFGFDGFGDFLSIYSRFDLDPKFPPKYFDKTVLKYTDSSNKRPVEVWELQRPVPLMADEANDYRKKDSLEIVRKNPRYLDSLDKIRNKVTVMGLLFSGLNFSREKKRENWSFDPLFENVNFNTVEGLSLRLHGTYSKRIDSLPASRRRLYVAWGLRYGFSNSRFNAHLTTRYSFGKKLFNSIEVSGGKRVFQFNQANPVPNRFNTYSTLLWERNFLKIYEAWYGRFSFTKALDDGFSFSASAQYQDRIPLVNTTEYKWKDFDDRAYTPNYPTELVNAPMPRHQALTLAALITWRPGSRYIEFPGQKFSIGSRYPRFSLSYVKGIRALGGDADFDRWRFSVGDDVNLKLGGRLNYNLAIGGFLNDNRVELPDYQHISGNPMTVFNNLPGSLRLPQFYQYGTKASFYTLAQLEYHLNGLLTNKLPVFRKLKWNLVTGSNLFYESRNRNYVEVYAGIENILRVIRVDYTIGFQSTGGNLYGFRVVLPTSFGAGTSDD